MLTNRRNKRWSVFLAGLGIAGVVAYPLVNPSAAMGQGRNGGDRGGPKREDNGPRRDSPPPRREEAPPRREEAPPRREEAPPRREEAPPRREEAPPRREQAPPRREEAPPPRREEVNPPKREETQPQRREDPPTRRDNPPTRVDDNRPKRDEPPTRRDDPPTRPTDNSGDRSRNINDRTAPPDRGDRSNGGDRGNRNDNTRPQRDNGDRSIDRTNNQGRNNGNISDRRGPTRDGNSNGGNRDVFPGSRSDTRRDNSTLDNRNRSWNPSPQHDRATDIFTRSREGRRFNSGIYLREGGYIHDTRIRRYFSGWDYCSYPWYYPSFEFSVSYWSPYSFYYDVCPPYIYRQHTYYLPPSVVYIEVPVYVRSEARGWDDEALDDYYLNRRGYDYNADDVNDRGLNQAVDDIEDTFREGRIESLVYLTDPKIRIAVYRSGKYQYSLDSNDYLDLTRDALRVTDTVSYKLDRIRRKGSGTYVASGKHVYRDRDGKQRTVYVSFAMEKIDNRWTITQVGTAPDRIQ